MYPNETKAYATYDTAEQCAEVVPSFDGVSQATHNAAACLDAVEEIVSSIETRIHGPRPALALANGKGQAGEPGLLRVASSNAHRLDRLRDRLAKISATV